MIKQITLAVLAAMTLSCGQQEQKHSDQGQYTYPSDPLVQAKLEE